MLLFHDNVDAANNNVWHPHTAERFHEDFFTVNKSENMFLCWKRAAFIPGCRDFLPNINLLLSSTFNRFWSDNSASTFIDFEMVYILSASSGAPSCNDFGFPSVWSCIVCLSTGRSCLIEDGITFSSVNWSLEEIRLMWFSMRLRLLAHSERECAQPYRNRISKYLNIPSLFVWA